MRSLVAIFTHSGNGDYFRECLRYTMRAINNVSGQTRLFRKGFGRESLISLMIIDFSKDDDGKVKGICKEFHTGRVPEFTIVNRPNAGFCDNVNYILEEANLRDFEILFEINDDSMVHNQFFSNALDTYAYNKNYVFVGGVPQETGGWNDSIRKLYVPQPEDKKEEITNFTRLWWEMSACAMNVEKISSTRFDTRFDDFLGVVGDNDFLLRLAKKYPNRLIRNWLCRFWHARGITQSKFGRDPTKPIDIHKIEAARYFKEKWGQDISDMNKLVTADQCYNEPFNGLNIEECKNFSNRVV